MEPVQPDSSHEANAQELTLASEYAREDLAWTQKILKGEKDMTVFKGKVDFPPFQDQLVFLIFLAWNGEVVKRMTLYVDRGLEQLNMAISWKTVVQALEEAEKNSFVEQEKTAFSAKKLEKLVKAQWLSRAAQETAGDFLGELQLNLEKELFYVFRQGLVLHLDLEKENSLMYHRFFNGEISAPEKQFVLAKKRMAEDPVFESQKQILLKSRYQILPGEYHLSPVKGKSLSEFLPGQGMGVKILSYSPEAKKAIQALELTDPQGEILPIRGKVLAVSKNEDGIQCLVEIAPGLALETPREEDIKVEFVSIAPKKVPLQKTSLALVIAGAAVLAVLVSLLLILIS